LRKTQQKNDNWTSGNLSKRKLYACENSPDNPDNKTKDNRARGAINPEHDFGVNAFPKEAEASLS
jgi:hypothetical protein